MNIIPRFLATSLVALGLTACQQNETCLQSGQDNKQDDTVYSSSDFIGGKDVHFDAEKGVRACAFSLDYTPREHDPGFWPMSCKIFNEMSAQKIAFSYGLSEGSIPEIEEARNACMVAPRP